MSLRLRDLILTLSNAVGVDQRRCRHCFLFSQRHPWPLTSANKSFLLVPECGYETILAHYFATNGYRFETSHNYSQWHWEENGDLRKVWIFLNMRIENLE